jgi:hypothetical protein
MELKFSEVKLLLNNGIKREQIKKLKLNRQLMSRNPIYWILKGRDLEQAQFESNKRTPGKFEYFRYYKNYSTDEDALEAMNKYNNENSVTKENMIRNHGEIIGLQKWNDYCQKQSVKNTFEFKKDKYGWTEEQFKVFNNSRAVTLSNSIKKHGIEKGTKIYNSYVEKQRYAGCKLDYFIEKYGEIEGERKYKEVNIKKSHSLEGYLLITNGDFEKANELYNTYQTTQNKTYSNISQELFEILRYELIQCGIDDSDIYFAEHNFEWFINNSTQLKNYYLDFYVSSVNKVIEFNGDYWHCNPNKYKQGELIEYLGRGIIDPMIIWEEDKNRLNDIKKIPYIKDVLIVWESDFKNNPLEVVENCMKFLLE